MTRQYKSMQEELLNRVNTLENTITELRDQLEASRNHLEDTKREKDQIIAGVRLTRPFSRFLLCRLVSVHMCLPSDRCACVEGGGYVTACVQYVCVCVSALLLRF